jgi:leucyl aminopeptidase
MRPTLRTVSRTRASRRLRYASNVTDLDTLHFGTAPEGTRPLWFISEADLPLWRAGLPGHQRTWLDALGFAAERLRLVTLPDAGGGVGGAVLGLGAAPGVDALSIWHAASLPDRLPQGRFQPAQELGAPILQRLALGWLLGAYRLNQFRSIAQPLVRAGLQLRDAAPVAPALAAAAALNDARNLINAPANELGPQELADAVALTARSCGAQLRVVTGAELEAGYPLVHAVGRASTRAPCLIDLRWGDASAPRVTLVGKGVCFDSGGLDLKPAAGMLLMKKDMGGAAVALATARMLMELRAPIQLRLLIPAVENAVAGNACRPGDVVRSRSGLSVEINNTDAEGRLILADALADADSETPSLLVDFATLTGAARTALGPELPAAFSTGRRPAARGAAHR